MKIKILISALLIAIFADATISSAQLFSSRDPVKKQFNEAVDEYNAQNYERALQLFRELYSSNTQAANSVSTAVHLMMVKSYYQLGLYRQSLNYGKQFLSQYGQSSYLDDIYIALAEAYLHLHQYENAATYYSFAITETTDETIARIALDNLLKTTDAFLSSDEVQALVDGAVSQNEMNIFRLCLLQEFILAGEMSLASTTAMELERASLGNLLLPTFQAFKKAISLESQKQIAIGVIAPLTGSFSDVGNDVLLGAQYALSQRSNLRNVSIIPLDNQRSGIESVAQMERAGNHNRIIATIGPIWSENVIAAAATAGIYQLPLVSPTATDVGIAQLNDYVFQLSPDYSVRGKAAAQYAIDSLHLKTFAVISPADMQGKSLTDAFSAEVEARGGEILNQGWYSGTPEDLSQQFSRLRELGFNLRTEYGEGIDSSAVLPGFDSLRTTMPDSQFVARFRRELREYTENVDSTEITLRHIDGMYFPIRSGEMDYVANQFAFHNFDTQLLGNVEWYDIDKLQEHSTLIDSILIFSDYYIPENQSTYDRFVSQFRQETNSSPNQLVLYGYDTMNLLLDLIEDGQHTRASLANSLTNIRNFDGLIREITLGGYKPRVNQSVQVLQYARRNLRPVDEMTIGARQKHPMQSILSQ